MSLGALKERAGADGVSEEWVGVAEGAVGGCCCWGCRVIELVPLVVCWSGRSIPDGHGLGG